MVQPTVHTLVVAVRHSPLAQGSHGDCTSGPSVMWVKVKSVKTLQTTDWDLTGDFTIGFTQYV